MKILPERISFKQGASFETELAILKGKYPLNLFGHSIVGGIFKLIPTYEAVAELDITVLNQSQNPGRFLIGLSSEQTRKIKHREVYIADFSIVSPDGRIIDTPTIFVRVELSPQFALNRDNSEQTTDDEENNAENEP